MAAIFSRRNTIEIVSTHKAVYMCVCVKITQHNGLKKNLEQS